MPMDTVPSALLLATAAAAALLCGPLEAAAHLSPPGGSADNCPTSAAIARSAQQLCSSSPVADSLQSVGLAYSDNLIANDSDDARPAASLLLRQLLQDHGLRTALDLRLLRPGGAEAAELMEELRTGGISIGDRSKVRLLLGDEGPSDGTRPGGIRWQDHRTVADGERTPESQGLRRQLQGSSDGMSTDTIAIVLSVLFGAAGYLVQVSSDAAAAFQT
eukprot:SAG31_NODE_5107_length_2740_cov_4.443014_2_plen_218_part_00